MIEITLSDADIALLESETQKVLVFQPILTLPNGARMPSGVSVSVPMDRIAAAKLAERLTEPLIVEKPRRENGEGEDTPRMATSLKEKRQRGTGS